MQSQQTQTWESQLDFGECKVQQEQTTVLQSFFLSHAQEVAVSALFPSSQDDD